MGKGDQKGEGVTGNKEEKRGRKGKAVKKPNSRGVSGQRKKSKEQEGLGKNSKCTERRIEEKGHIWKGAKTKV